MEGTYIIGFITLLFFISLVIATNNKVLSEKGTQIQNHSIACSQYYVCVGDEVHKFLTYFQILFADECICCVRFTNETVPFWDLNLSISNGTVSTKIYDKRDDLDIVKMRTSMLMA